MSSASSVDSGRSSSPDGVRAVRVKFPLDEGEQLLKELGQPSVQACERVVLATVSLSATRDRDNLLVHSVHPVPAGAYRAEGLASSWDPRFTAKIAQEAMKLRLGVAIIHAHSFRSKPTLSRTDEQGFLEVLRPLKEILPKRPHASIVLGPERSVGGLVWLEGRMAPVESAVWIGSPLRSWPRARPKPPVKGEMYDSQILLIGRYGQELLRNSTIGIVGVGGGGSHVAEQVARAGFGHILLVDHDVVEGKNRSRMVGTRPGDGGKLKVSVIERLIRETGSGAIVTSIAEKFPSENGIKCLKEADLVVSCVDTLSSRSELIQFAWRHLIPLIDIGIGTTVQSSAEPRGLTAAAGHIHVYLPGGPCMYCSGLVSDSGIIAETGGKPEYIKGARSPGQVISFNGVVASMAVTEAINLITGSLVSETRPRFILYDVIGAKLHELAVKRNPVCRVCSQDLGAGDPIW